MRVIVERKSQTTGPANTASLFVLCSLAASANPPPAACGLDWDFTRRTVLQQCKIRPGLKPHACSAVHQPSKRAAAANPRTLAYSIARLSGNLAAHDRLNLSIALIGDSLMTQLHDVAKCAARRAPQLRLNWIPMHVLPRDSGAALLTETLSMAAAQHDLILLNIGAWYNWQPNEFTTLGELLLENTTARGPEQEQLESCAQLLPYHEWIARGKPINMKQYAMKRRSCMPPLGLRAYIADLKLLVEVLGKLVEADASLADRIVWRSSVAQHYPTRAGTYDPARYIAARWPFGLSAGVPCAPIQQQHEDEARQRNVLASRVLAGRGRVLRHTMDTWATDAALWDQHSAKRRGGRPLDVQIDCTHFCLHSDATWEWLQALERLICSRSVLRPESVKNEPSIHQG